MEKAIVPDCKGTMAFPYRALLFTTTQQPKNTPPTMVSSPIQIRQITVK